MTKEEAIDFGKMWLDMNEDAKDSNTYVFIKLAIEALAQQPSDDCITKTEVINTIHETIYGFFDIADDDSEEPINDKDKLLLTINKAISNAVKALPSVTPQSRTGHWEDCSNGWCCSNCWRDVSHESDFCPHCGADMRESEDEK